MVAKALWRENTVATSACLSTAHHLDELMDGQAVAAIVLGAEHGGNHTLECLAG